MSKTARMSHYGACWTRVVGGELPEICQRRRLVTPGAAPLDLASPHHPQSGLALHDGGVGVSGERL
jgi:hypothetical protein